MEITFVEAFMGAFVEVTFVEAFMEASVEAFMEDSVEVNSLEASTKNADVAEFPPCLHIIGSILKFQNFDYFLKVFACPLASGDTQVRRNYTYLVPVLLNGEGVLIVLEGTARCRR